MQASSDKEMIENESPFINSAGKGLAHHVPKFCISHLTPGITIDGKVLQANKPHF